MAGTQHGSIHTSWREMRNQPEMTYECKPKHPFYENTLCEICTKKVEWCLFSTWTKLALARKYKRLQASKCNNYNYSFAVEGYNKKTFCSCKLRRLLKRLTKSDGSFCTRIDELEVDHARPWWCLAQVQWWYGVCRSQQFITWRWKSSWKVPWGKTNQKFLEKHSLHSSRQVSRSNHIKST